MGQVQTRARQARHSGARAALAALIMGVGLTAPVQAQQAGPEGHSYQVQTQQDRYTVRFLPDNRYQDSRPRQGRWQFDGRTLCMLVAGAGPRQPEYEVCTPWRALDVGQGYDSRHWTADGAPARITRID